MMSSSTDSEFILPFDCLNNFEFIQLFRDIDHSNSVCDLNDLLCNRDMNLRDDHDLNNDFDTAISCNVSNTQYITTEEISDLSISQNSLSILQINARSLNKNFDRLVNLLSNFKSAPSIISISETWLKSNDQNSFLSLNNFTFVSRPRQINKRGGWSGFICIQFSVVYCS